MKINPAHFQQAITQSLRLCLFLGLYAGTWACGSDHATTPLILESPKATEKKDADLTLQKANPSPSWVGSDQGLRHEVSDEPANLSPVKDTSLSCANANISSTDPEDTDDQGDQSENHDSNQNLDFSQQEQTQRFCET